MGDIADGCGSGIICVRRRFGGCETNIEGQDLRKRTNTPQHAIIPIWSAFTAIDCIGLDQTLHSQGTGLRRTRH